MILPRPRLHAILLLAILPGCLDVNSVDPPRQSIWEVEGIEPFDLENPEVPYFVGAAGIISGAGRTEFGILLEQAEPFQDFGWSIRLGDCEAGGGPVTAFDFTFPTLSTDAGGEARATVLLNGNLEVERSYSAAIYLDSADGERIACGDFSLRG